MQELLKVATRGTDCKLRWLSWQELPQLQWYKKLYKTKPNHFIEIDGVLYKKSLEKASQRVRTLLNSCLKIAGTRYALALTLSGGDRQSAKMHRIYEDLCQRAFRDKEEWVETLERYIKDHGVKVAVINDGATHWLEFDEEVYVKPAVMKTYFSDKPHLFERIGAALYFLPMQKILLENMFFRAVEIAGSEYKLAVSLSDDKRSRSRHLKNFERMGFTHRENFKTYADMLSAYLIKTQTLFAEEAIDG